MAGSLRVVSRDPMKIAAALVVTGALSIGLAAWGGPAAWGSGSNESSSSVPTRNFSLTRPNCCSTRHVHLVVINPDPVAITVTICVKNVSCKPAATLGKDQRADMAAGRVNGMIRYADGYTVHFEAFNPSVELPWVKVTSTQGKEFYCQRGSILQPEGDGHSCQLHLAEGGAREARVVGYKLVAKRAADTSKYKMLSLTAYGQ